MPLNLAAANPIGVLPQMTYILFTPDEIFPMYAPTFYKDNTVERNLVLDGVNAARPIHTWKCQVRLTAFSDLSRPGALALATLKDFWDLHNGPQIPFYFYDPTLIGTVYDSTGDNEINRFTVRFSNQSWTQTPMLSRTTVAFDLEEVA